MVKAVSGCVASDAGWLPNEPSVVFAQQQAELTAAYLLPALPQLEKFFWWLRGTVDAELQSACPVKQGKLYPLGQCLEISLAVQQRLAEIVSMDVPGDVIPGYDALMAFQAAGGVLRQVWGDLRREYFQNAFQVGALYVDVSNDTVTVTKPKVEILPFEQANFVAVQDFRHFMRVARNYWQGELYPNHVLPELAPYCPLIHVSPAGLVTLCEASRYMLSLTERAAFVLSEEVLADALMPVAVFEQIIGVLRGQRDGVGMSLPASVAEGREASLAMCAQFRQEQRHLSERYKIQAALAAQQVNQVLQKHIGQRVTKVASPVRMSQCQELKMQELEQVEIDGVQYRLADLSAEARQQLEMLVMADQRLKELQRDVAITQTAHKAYLQAFRQLV